MPPSGSLQASEFIFAGYGIQDSVSGWNDYRDLDITGKVVLIVDGEPMDKKGNSRITGTKEPGAWKSDRDLKIDLAIRKKAAAVWMVHSDYKKFYERMQRRMKSGSYSLNNKQAKETTPVLFLTPETADALLAGEELTTDAFRKQTSVKRKYRPRKIASDISFAGSLGQTACNNVLGYVEGTDKKDEVVVVSAHLDHLGVIDDKIYYGADDDGSGCASILNMAEAFATAKKDGQGPRRSILFIAFSGEEKGLLGSEYYTERPVFPIDKTIANLNIDMIGRRDTISRPDTNYTYIIGSDKLSKDLHHINETANGSCCELMLDYRYNDPGDRLRLYYRSDHYNFAKKNIPVIFYFTGLHADYHKPTDTIDKIEFDKMLPIARLVFHTAWELANREETIRVDVKTDKP